MHFTQFTEDELLTDNCPYIRAEQADGQFRAKEPGARGTQRNPEMIRGLILTGLLVLLWHQMDVQAHILNKHSPISNMAKLKSLLQQFEEALAAEEAPERGGDYEDSNPALEQSVVSTSWDREREEEAAPAEDSNPSDGFETQRNRLIDLLMSTRSKSLSGCFGGRLDRIGSSSTLGCNSKKG